MRQPAAFLRLLYQRVCHVRLRRECRPLVVGVAPFASSVARTGLTSDVGNSYDPASLHILSRLDQLLGQQGEVLSAIQNLGGNHDLPQPSPENDSSYSIPSVSNQSGINPPTSPGDSFLLSETAANHLKIPSARTIPDHILAWLSGLP
ncbi:hypothetical protein V501_03484 [Pseudogymnoascus sp. VKM F-4519 (FW-2642)]|nr:hypothetical protein V501_03484 [Pseudogymnoascus sp. VKM F-4519 (FW-2642)]